MTRRAPTPSEIRKADKLSNYTTLLGVAPNTCLFCNTEADVTIWRECDEFDKPTDALIACCERCVATEIERHPRLYKDTPRNAPLPGAMFCCVDCKHRDALRCTHPDLKANGGAGLEVQHSAPVRAFVDGTFGGRRTGFAVTIYAQPPRCTGQETSS